MNSVQTKETPSALTNLLKAKGQRSIGHVQTPVATIVENQITEIPATSELTPEDETDIINNEGEVIPATLEPQTPEPSDNGRNSTAYKELKQYHDKTVYELRTELKELGTQLSQATTKKVELPKTKEEIQSFKDKNQDAYDTIRTIVLEELSTDDTFTDIKKQIENVNKATSELKEKEAFKKLLEAHPDAMEIRQSPQFAKWFNEQPDDIKNILSRSTDIQAVSKQLTLYKIETGLVTVKDKKKADSKKRVDDSLGVDVKGRTDITAQKKIWTKTELDKVCGHYPTYLKFAKEIDDARREGRVDMSK